MAVSLGKRKRRDVTAKEENSDDDAAARALFQKAFEAKFNPLPRSEKPVSEDVSEDDDEGDSSDGSDDDEWDGLSDGASPPEQVEVVEHSTIPKTDLEREKRELKAFMSSKPPTSSTHNSTTKVSKSAKPSKDENGDDATDSANAAHDLALQRLLKESHLLDPTTFNSTADSTPEGKSRIKALDLRIQGLGAKGSHLEQESMPMGHRRGMVAKAEEREGKRRREARENGIVLEREAGRGRGGGRGRGVRSGGGEARERGIGAPGVGRMRGGTLSLSKADVRSIESSGERGRGGKGGRGRGGKGSKRGRR